MKSWFSRRYLSREHWTNSGQSQLDIHQKISSKSSRTCLLLYLSLQPSLFKLAETGWSCEHGD